VAIEEGLLLKEHSVHVGIRGSLYAASDLSDDEELGFTIVHAREFHTSKFLDIIDRVNKRVGDAPLYVSIDIDVLDPAHAPGTGTPEAGGLTSRELLELLRGLTTPNLVGADIVEVAPAYDHASITAVAAAHFADPSIGVFDLEPATQEIRNAVHGAMKILTSPHTARLAGDQTLVASHWFEKLNNGSTRLAADLDAAQIRAETRLQELGRTGRERREATAVALLLVAVAAMISSGSRVDCSL
jgi:hypothetical protein